MPSEGILERADGSLILDNIVARRHVIWPSSAGEGAVLRVSTESMEIEASFWTGAHHGGGARGRDGGDSPSGTAVDDSGNLIIANRGFRTWGSITKIAADPAACPDRNGNGVVDTSTGWDDRLQWDADDDWSDECVLWHTTVGGRDSRPWAIAIHAALGIDQVVEEVGWVGVEQEERFLQFDAETGELTGVEAATPGVTPHAAAIDREGWLWATYSRGMVGRFDTARPADTFELVLVDVAAERVIVDENDVPWIGWNHDVLYYDRDASTAFALGMTDGMDLPSCGPIASDGEGSLWVSSLYSDEIVYRIDNDGVRDYETVATPGTRTNGMAVDFDRQAWTFGLDDEVSGIGNATVIDLDTGTTRLALDDCGGQGCLSFAEPDGDLTGLQRRNALDPIGGWSRTIDGCDRGASDWRRILIDAETGPGTQLRVLARTADSPDGLRGAAWIPVGTVPADGSQLDLDSPFGLAGVADGQSLMVGVVLQSLDHVSSPALRRVEVQWACPSGG